ncbi:MAG TPA: Ig-like domain-containing protein [Tepidisphaeraceae bacterium]|nr:Ig-like domain-containing protein [Tepidisphaeraceae bacterium]
MPRRPHRRPIAAVPAPLAAARSARRLAGLIPAGRVARAVACTVETLEGRRLLCQVGHDYIDPASNQQMVHLHQAAPDDGSSAQLGLFGAGARKEKLGPKSRQELQLSAAQDGARLAAVGPQAAALTTPAPTGGLAGKVAYLSAGHGWTWTVPSTGAPFWGTQRGNNNALVEDFQTQDQISYYAQYLLNAGATVVPTRPIGHQTAQVIVDNHDAGFSTPLGAWSTNTASSTYWSNTGGTDTADRYRHISASTTETHVARFTPTIAAAGYYPVYTWVNNGDNRITNQVYRINSAGGSQEVKVNHKYTGKGWIYLGTYYFDAGAGGNVEISNRSDQVGAVVADAIRFGNGMGDYSSGGGISGKPREDEAALYWLYRSRGYTASGTLAAASNVDGGISGDYDANIGAPPRWAAYMNDHTQGTIKDRIFLSIHSNAFNGTTRGTTSLIHSSNPTPNQSAWANAMSAEVEGDLIALGNAQLIEHTWGNYSNTLSGVYGEISNGSIAGEFDATLLEVAFHDNATDAQLLRDPKVRNHVARAAYQATAKFLNGAATTLLPDVPTAVRATTTAAGAVTLTWTAPGTGTATGGSGAATSYKVYTSANGLAWSDVIVLGNVTTHTLTGLPTNAPTYFKVVAVNAGGESLTRDVVAAHPMPAQRAPVLIVNGFDRFDRTANDTIAYGAGTTERVRYRYQNTRDYVIAYAEALKAYDPNLGFEFAQNEEVASNVINLADYQYVLWISGEESTADDTFSATEQSRITSYLNAGGKLLVSGAELGWDLVQAGGGAQFMTNPLRAGYASDAAGNYDASDDAGTYAASGLGNSAFASVGSITFDNGAAEGASGTYDVGTPDVLTVSGGSTAAMNYSTGGIAAVQYAGGSTGNTRVITMGFPFETLTTVAARNAVMAGTMAFFKSSPAPGAAPAAPDLAAGSDSGSSTNDNRTNRNNASGKSLQFSVTGTVAGATVTIYSDGVAIGSAQASGATTTVNTNALITLADGTRNVTATMTLPGGAESAPSAALPVTIDTVAATPPAPDLAAGSDSGSSTTDNRTKATTPAFTGSAEAGTVTLLVDGSPVGTAPVSGGTYSVAPTSAVAAGTRAFTVTVTDSAGNVSAASPALSVIIDTAAPPARNLNPGATSTTITVYYDSTATDVWRWHIYRATTSGGPYTQVATPTATGSAGNYTDSTVTPGQRYYYVISAEDTSGNEGAVSAEVTAEARSAPPGGVLLATASDTGRYDNDLATYHDNSSGKPLVFKPTGIVAGSTVRLYLNGALAATAVADGAGNVSLTPSGALAEGTYGVHATQQEPGNVESLAGTARTLTIDTTGPAVSKPDMTAASDTGVYDSDNATSNTLPVFTGTAEAGVPLTFLIDGIEVGSDADGNGTYSFAPAAALADGLYSVTVVGTDAAGNVTTTAALIARIDTVAPGASLAAGQAPTGGAGAFDFFVTYTGLDDGVIFTLDDGDITVTGPHGFSADATLIASGAGGGSTRTATYRVAAPGGAWSAADAGAYSVKQNANQIADLAGNARPAGTIGTFAFSAPFAHVSGGALRADFLAPGGTIALTVNGANLDVTQGGETLSFATAEFSSIIGDGTTGDDTVTTSGALATTIAFNGNGGGGDAVHVAAGTLTLGGDLGAATPGIDFSVAPGAAAVFNATQHLGDLDIDGAATLAAGGAKVLVVTGLAVAGQLDLRDNDLIWKAGDLGSRDGSSYTGALGLIASGRAGSSWSGAGIVTSMPASQSGTTPLGAATAGVALNLADGQTALWNGQTVGAADVLVKYTYAGDADLNGRINGDDYFAIDTHASAPAASTWPRGDFDYNGRIDGDDYFLIDSTLGRQTGVL